MVDVVELPPNTPPKQLTANYASGNLLDHFVGFLSHNNANKFADESDSDIDVGNVNIRNINHLDIGTIGELMLILAQFDYIPHSVFKKYGIRLCELSNKKLSLLTCYHILSRMLGYKDHSTLVFHLYKRMSPAKKTWMKRNKTEVLIRNRRDRRTIKMAIYESTDFKLPETWERDINLIMTQIKKLKEEQ